MRQRISSQRFRKKKRRHTGTYQGTDSSVYSGISSNTIVRDHREPACNTNKIIFV